MSRLGANALGEVLAPGRVPDCYLGLRLDPSGTEAADVLAWRSTVTITFPGSSPSLGAVESRMRLLAWWGTSQSIAEAGR